MTCIDIYDIRVCPLCAHCGFTMPAAEFPDVMSIHTARLARHSNHRRLARRTYRRQPREMILDTDTIVCELDSGKCTMSMYRLDHQGQVFDVAVVP